MKNARITRKWIRNTNDEAAIVEGCYFDQKAADHVCNFFERCLCHTDGEYAGQPFLLLPWERDLLSRLFGWKNADGRRRFRQCATWISKKNGKTELVAGVICYMLACDGEIGAEIYSCAHSLRNAHNCFKVVAAMVQLSPQLRPHFEVIPSTRRVIFSRTHSYYEVLSGRAPSSEGFKVHAAFIDEIHTAHNSAMFDTLRYGGRGRRQPLIMSISTAGVFDPASFAWQQWQLTCEIDKGIKIQTDFLPIIYAAEPEDDWACETIWAKANPSLGHHLRLDDFRKDFEEAKAVPSKQFAFLRYSLNRWTQALETWIPDDKILECAGSTELTDEENDEVWWTAGLDMANTQDLSAFVLVGHLPGKKVVIPHFWCNEEQAKVRQNRDGANGATYITWAKAGYITKTSGNTISYSHVKKDILALCEKYKPKFIGYDRWNIAQMVQELQDDHGLPVWGFGQGYKDMSGPTKELERLILSRELKLGDPVNPVLRWMFKNIKIEMDAAENIKIDRKRKKEKVDGCIALVMAIGVGMAPDQTSVYESEKPFFI